MEERALRHAARLPTDDPTVLATRLYRFGTLPRSARWDRLVGLTDDTSLALGVGRGGPFGGALAASHTPSADAAWWSWRARSGAAGDGLERGSEGGIEGSLQHLPVAPLELPPSSWGPALRHKVYVSPRPEAMAPCLAALGPVITRHSAASLKVARGVQGLLRPDKIVLYADSESVRDLLATAVSDALGGLAAQRVPFTTALDGSSLVSCATDPPAPAAVGLLRRQSWRWWVTNRLASALVSIPRADRPERWEDARSTVDAAGVDTRGWSVTAQTWATS